MANLLHLDASPREERSHSRKLTKEFIETWQKANPKDSIVYRDIGRNSIPHVTEAWIAAAFTPEDKRSPEMKQALSLSDELIDELYLIMIAAIATSSAFVPAMQRGKVWARYTHISFNILLLVFFGWQSITGLQIVREILTGS